MQVCTMFDNSYWILPALFFFYSNVNQTDFFFKSTPVQEDIDGFVVMGTKRKGGGLQHDTCWMVFFKILVNKLYNFMYMHMERSNNTGIYTRLSLVASHSNCILSEANLRIHFRF